MKAVRVQPPLTRRIFAPCEAVDPEALKWLLERRRRRKPGDLRVDDSQERRYITIAVLETSPGVSPCFGADLRPCDGVRCAVADRTSTAHGSQRTSRLGLQYS